jgi:hypothetical protein
MFSLQSPTPGISCWLLSDDKMDEMEASIAGPPDSPFHGGVFKLKIVIPVRYPFEPPQGKQDTFGTREYTKCTAGVYILVCCWGAYWEFERRLFRKLLK